jgi:hypothetical protein
VLIQNIIFSIGLIGLVSTITFSLYSVCTLWCFILFKCNYSMPLFYGIPLYLDISQLECIWLKFIGLCHGLFVCMCVWLRFQCWHRWEKVGALCWWHLTLTVVDKWDVFVWFYRNEYNHHHSSRLIILLNRFQDGECNFTIHHYWQSYIMSAHSVGGRPWMQ